MYNFNKRFDKLYEISLSISCSAMLQMKWKFVFTTCIEDTAATNLAESILFANVLEILRNSTSQILKISTALQ